MPLNYRITDSLLILADYIKTLCLRSLLFDLRQAICVRRLGQCVRCCVCRSHRTGSRPLMFWNVQSCTPAQGLRICFGQQPMQILQSFSLEKRRDLLHSSASELLSLVEDEMICY